MDQDHNHLNEYTRGFLQKALDKGVIDSGQFDFLLESLTMQPDSLESGLDTEVAGQFIQTTLQLIEVCLDDRDRPRDL